MQLRAAAMSGWKWHRARWGMALADVLAEEVRSINERIGLPEQVTVVVADCGEANAY